MNAPTVPANSVLRLLVTGGAGYIGSVTATRLLERGHEVTVFDDLSTGHRDAVPPGATFVHGDITDSGALDEVMREIDAVVHFAAKSLVGESVTDPSLYYRTNVGGSVELLDAMRRHQVSTIVFSSTAATYGEPTSVPILETAATRPTNPYGLSKLAIDGMLGAYAHAYGLAPVSLRYFNVAGAYGTCRERHDPESHLIPNLLRVATGERDHATLFGTDYDTPDGTCIRDYVHVEDLADAHALALVAARSSDHQIFNLGSGNGFSNRSVIETVRAVTGHPLPVIEGPRRAGDPARLIASSALARSRLGWSPQKEDLTAMVGDAWTALQGAARS